MGKGDFGKAKDGKRKSSDDKGKHEAPFNVFGKGAKCSKTGYELSEPSKGKCTQQSPTSYDLGGLTARARATRE